MNEPWVATPEDEEKAKEILSVICQELGWTWQYIHVRNNINGKIYKDGNLIAVAKVSSRAKTYNPLQVSKSNITKYRNAAQSNQCRAFLLTKFEDSDIYTLLEITKPRTEKSGIIKRRHIRSGMKNDGGQPCWEFDASEIEIVKKPIIVRPVAPIFVQPLDPQYSLF
jgi:hypothetical protein